jgi:hypothetical protein
MILFSIFIFVSSAQVGSVADAMGGAGIGGAHPYESAILNPAALVEFKSKHFGMQQRKTDLGPNLDQEQYSFFFTDAGETTVVPGTVFYRQRSNQFLDQKVREQHLQISGAAALTQTLSVGASGYKIKTNLMSGDDYNQYNLDLGTYWLALPNLTVGGVFRGVMGSESTEWPLSQVLPMAGTGAEYRFFEMFKLRYDINYFLEQNGDKRFRHQIGGEVRYDYMLALRAGWSQDDRLGENRVTLGVGWDGPRLKVAYAFQKEDRKQLGDAHSVDMWFDF